MTAQEFNNKWNKYLAPGFYGLRINDPEVTDYLDKEFEKEVESNPSFSYYQIKLKFGTSRVYAESGNAGKWEQEINNILKEDK